MKVFELLEDAGSVDSPEMDALERQEKKNIYAFLRGIETWWNRKYSKTMPIDTKGPGLRVWTRGDGTRHRDPAMIKAGYYGNLLPGQSRDQTIAALWKTLTSQPGAKPAGTISGEFGSSQFHDAISFRGFILVNRGYAIDVMSRSRVTNKSSVWRQK